jgi:hypothetical protein
MSKEIEELEDYFNSIENPLEPIRLNTGTLIVDYSKFIKTHLQAVKSLEGRISKPYLDRLQELKSILTNKEDKKII